MAPDVGTAIAAGSDVVQAVPMRRGTLWSMFVEQAEHSFQDHTETLAQTRLMPSPKLICAARQSRKRPLYYAKFLISGPVMLQ